MFCDISQKLGNRGAWPTRGIADAIELLRQHANSKWYIDDAANATMTKQAERMQSVLKLWCSKAAHEAAELRQRNFDVWIRLLRSAYFFVKNRIPHMTVYPHLI